MKRVEQIIDQALAGPLTTEAKQILHRRVTGYLYQTIITNFPDQWAITDASGNPVVIAVVKSPSDRVQVLGWEKVDGRIENGAEAISTSSIAQSSSTPRSPVCRR